MWIGCSSQENSGQEDNQYLLVEVEQPVRLQQGTPGGAGLLLMKHVGCFLIKRDVGKNERSETCEKRPGRGSEETSVGISANVTINFRWRQAFGCLHRIRSYSALFIAGSA
jgi:hypothetical protein